MNGDSSGNNIYETITYTLQDLEDMKTAVQDYNEAITNTMENGMTSFKQVVQENWVNTDADKNIVDTAEFLRPFYEQNIANAKATYNNLESIIQTWTSRTSSGETTISREQAQKVEVDTAKPWEDYNVPTMLMPDESWYRTISADSAIGLVNQNSQGIINGNLADFIENITEDNKKAINSLTNSAATALIGQGQGQALTNYLNALNNFNLKLSDLATQINTALKVAAGQYAEIGTDVTSNIEDAASEGNSAQ